MISQLFLTGNPLLPRFTFIYILQYLANTLLQIAGLIWGTGGRGACRGRFFICEVFLTPVAVQSEPRSPVVLPVCGEERHCTGDGRLYHSARARLMELRARTMDLRARLMDLRARTMDLRARLMDLRARTMELRTRTMDLRARTMDLRARTIELIHRQLLEQQSYWSGHQWSRVKRRRTGGTPVPLSVR